MISASTHGGNQRQLAAMAGDSACSLIDFSANLNPLGFPDWLRPLISSQIAAICHYPDPDSTALREAASVRYGVQREEIVAGNGTEQLLHFLPRVMGKARAIIPVPAYIDYALSASNAGLEVVSVPMRSESGFSLDLAGLESRLRGDEAVYLGYPNNPTGTLPAAAALRSAHPDPQALLYSGHRRMADVRSGEGSAGDGQRSRQSGICRCAEEADRRV